MRMPLALPPSSPPPSWLSGMVGSLQVVRRRRTPQTATLHERDSPLPSPCLVAPCLLAPCVLRLRLRLLLGSRDASPTARNGGRGKKQSKADRGERERERDREWVRGGRGKRASCVRRPLFLCPSARTASSRALCLSEFMCVCLARPNPARLGCSAPCTAAYRQTLPSSLLSFHSLCLRARLASNRAPLPTPLLALANSSQQQQ
jgi:hypothetical protein